jgi:hypothetical protein
MGSLITSISCVKQQPEGKAKLFAPRISKEINSKLFLFLLIVDYLVSLLQEK